MGNILWKLDNAVTKLDILKDKFEMLEVNLTWFKDNNFSKPSISKQSELEVHFLSYREQYVFLNQHRDLLELYLKTMDEIHSEFLKIFNELKENEDTKKPDITTTDESEVISVNIGF